MVKNIINLMKIFPNSERVFELGGKSLGLLNALDLLNNIKAIDVEIPPYIQTFNYKDTDTTFLYLLV